MTILYAECISFNYARINRTAGMKILSFFPRGIVFLTPKLVSGSVSKVTKIKPHSHIETFSEQAKRGQNVNKKNT